MKKILVLLATYKKTLVILAALVLAILATLHPHRTVKLVVIGLFAASVGYTIRRS